MTDAIGQTDYRILAPPSISLAQFTSVLTAANSPAAGEAAGMYTAAVTRGVDPAVLLAIFHHESNYGKAGVATRTHSPGNLVYTPSTAANGGVRDPVGGRFAAYPTWTQGAADASRLLASGLYGASSAYSTARTFPARWAPSSDGNNPTAYGAAVVRDINAYRGLANPTLGTPNLAAGAALGAAIGATGGPPTAGTGAVASQAGAPKSAAPGPSGAAYAVVAYGLILAAALLLAVIFLTGE